MTVRQTIQQYSGTRLKIGRIPYWICLAVLLTSTSSAYTQDPDSADITDTGVWYQVPEPDQSDWSTTRKTGYAKTLKIDLGIPSAVISIPMLGLTVQVYPGTDKTSLERGAGWVEGTTLPGGNGNIAIAGHRDSYFRPLEKITLGATIDVLTDRGIREYQVSSITIVDALDMQPLLPTEGSVITLITCHPFRYRGYAPDRYIVRARMVEGEP
jgi:sortase A